MDKMTEDQKERFNKLTPLQQKVFTNVMAGMSNIDAYIAAGGKGVSQATKEANVSRMLSHAKVKSLLDEMKQSSVNDAIMSRQEMLERLSGLARVNMSDLIEWTTKPTERVTKDGEVEEVEQSLWVIKDSAQQDPEKMASISEVTAGKDGFKIKQHSPLAAMKQLADLAGYNDPIKVEQTNLNANYNIKSDDPKQASQEYLELLKGG
jgi:phage terminase small subunit